MFSIATLLNMFSTKSIIITLFDAYSQVDVLHT